MAAAIRVRILLLVLLGAAVVLAGRLDARGGRAGAGIDVTQVPLGLGAYAGDDLRLDDQTLLVLGASQHLNRQYRDAGEGRYWIFLGYFARQRFGSQIHSPRHCYPGSGWTIIDQRAGGGLGGPASELLLQREKERRVVLYQYRTRGGWTTSELRLKLEMARNALLGRPLDAAFLRFSTRVVPGESEDAARARLAGFVAAARPHVDAALPF